jgi:hypothetical protein
VTRCLERVAHPRTNRTFQNPGATQSKHRSRRAVAPSVWPQRRGRVCTGTEDVGGGTDRVGQ